MLAVGSQEVALKGKEEGRGLALSLGKDAAQEGTVH